MIGVGLLHALKVSPADSAAKNKCKIDAGSAKDVLAVLANILVPDLAHVDPTVVQERAKNAQCDHTPNAEDCAAHRACFLCVVLMKKDEKGKQLSWGKKQKLEQTLDAREPIACASRSTRSSLLLCSHD